MNNQILLNHILEHIYNNLGVLKSQPVSIVSPDFQLSDTLCFVDDEEIDHFAPMWAAKTFIQQGSIQILAADMSIDEEKEYSVLVELEKCPTYASYVCLDKTKQIYDSKLFILMANKWMSANTYLQATFLAGMEQMREAATVWQANPKTDLPIKLRSFLREVDG